MATVVQSVGILGVSGYSVKVQVKVLAGLSSVIIVGLGDTAVKEAKDRIESALDHFGFKLPKKKIIVNLSPADIKKTGTSFDLPMLIGLLVESEQIVPEDFNLDETVFIGEVGLSGELNGIKGILPVVIEAKKMGFKKVILPSENLYEASHVGGIELIGMGTLEEVVMVMEGRLHYQSQTPFSPIKPKASELDFSEVMGHDEMMIHIVAAAAGNHNLLFIGPPGCGKSMIAKRIPTIMPDLTDEELLEVMTIKSIAGGFNSDEYLRTKPFRSPHYNASVNAIIGGGTYAKPGEITLAHHGVLFLDELPEFSRRTLESLRIPLEDRQVVVSRVKEINTYPANFLLVAAMNPCPCGHHGSNKCICSPNDIKRYQQKISSPIMERLDIQKFLSKVSILKHRNGEKNQKFSSSSMKAQVVLARQIQQNRFKNLKGVFSNADMTSAQAAEFCILEPAAEKLMVKALNQMDFSVRVYSKFLQLAQTYADLDESYKIAEKHLMLALMSRDLDKQRHLGYAHG